MSNRWSKPVNLGQSWIAHEFLFHASIFASDISPCFHRFHVYFLCLTYANVGREIWSLPGEQRLTHIYAQIMHWRPFSALYMQGGRKKLKSICQSAQPHWSQWMVDQVLTPSHRPSLAREHLLVILHCKHCKATDQAMQQSPRMADWQWQAQSWSSYNILHKKAAHQNEINNHNRQRKCQATGEACCEALWNWCPAKQNHDTEGRSLSPAGRIAWAARKCPSACISPELPSPQIAKVLKKAYIIVDSNKPLLTAGVLLSLHAYLVNNDVPWCAM